MGKGQVNQYLRDQFSYNLPITAITLQVVM